MTADNPHVAAELKIRLRAHAPVMSYPANASVHNNLSDRLMRSNFVVNAAASGGDPACSLESMKFALTFINQVGDEMPDKKHMWITGDAMSSLISFNRKKTKFVFDETINMKPGWRERLVFSQDPMS